ncbi:hypothetical protein HDU97_008938 [Phlyctochytrium planicorne]|nr:hypothetical protein HDU97_008938 [Phlyctochytrium planicorne]
MVASIDTSVEEKVRSIRFIKNSIIGNNSKKRVYLRSGIIPILTSILASPNYSSGLKIEAVTVIGSLATIKDHSFSEHLGSDVHAYLFQGLGSTDLRLVEASARTLKILLHNFPYPELLKDNQVFSQQLLNLLSQRHTSRTCELTATIIARIADTADEKLKSQFIPCLPILVNLLESRHLAVQQASLDAIASLIKDSKEAATVLLTSPSSVRGVSSVEMLLDFVRDRNSINGRLLAASCLTNLLRTGNLPSEFLPRFKQGILPTLLKILAELSESDECFSKSASLHAVERAPLILSHLVAESEELQLAAMEGGAIQKLAHFIRPRKNIGAGLVGSKDEDLSKDKGLHIPTQVAVVYPDRVREADSDIKEKVMAALTWEGLRRLIDDNELCIQEQALNLLRNLACKKESDIEDVFNGLNESVLMSVLEGKLCWASEELKKGVIPSSGIDDIILQTLYVIVNISTGSERHKSAVMASATLLNAIMHFMSHEKSTIRVATVWCVINLSEVDDGGSQQRINALKQRGFDVKLRYMADDVDSDVRGRVKTALANFHIPPERDNDLIADIDHPMDA